jgi:hypothetical protein
MLACQIFIALAIAQARPENVVTVADKRALFKLMGTLPSSGGRYKVEGVAKGIPYTRVLLALTEDDVKAPNLYPFLALSGALASHKEARAVALEHFDQIAHPELKLLWAALLVQQPDPLRNITTFLKKALASPEDAKTLAAIEGPGFPAFKKLVNDRFEQGRANAVELVKTHRIEALPEFPTGFGYKLSSHVLAPNGSFHAIHRLEEGGGVFTYNLKTGLGDTRRIPEPSDVQAEGLERSFNSYTQLALNSRGDLLCSWTIRGNGDHGLGLLMANNGAFKVNRIKLSLDGSVLVDDRQGGWLIVAGAPQFTVFRVEADLSLTALGSFDGEGLHAENILDACMIAQGVLHCFWGDVDRKNHLRMRCIDFDIGRKTWLHDRLVQRIDEFVRSANRPKIVQLADKTLHYFWRVQTQDRQSKSAGTYYHSESDGNTIKLSESFEFSAVACDNRLVFCSTTDAAPNKIFFRVIHNGQVQAPTEITIAKDRKDALSLESMALAAGADRLWFMNKAAAEVICELRLSARNEKH